MSDSNDIILVQVGNASMLRDKIKTHYSTPPIGLLYMASTLRMHGYKVRVLSLMTRDYSAAALTSELRKAASAPLMVGLSIYTETADSSLDVAHLVRAVFPDTRIVAGGPHATFCEEEILACPDIDLIVRGEGESTIIELLEAITHPEFPLHQVAGLSFRSPEGDIVRTAARPNITMLDVLPFPDYETDCLDAMPGVLYVVSSRGCPGRCTFCCSRAYAGSMYRMHSAEWLFSLAYYQYGRRAFQVLDLQDDTFTVHWPRTKRFCELLKSIGPNFSMQVKSRVDFIRDEVLRALSEARCKVIHIGVESADQQVLSAIGKGTTLEQIYAAIRLMAKYGIRVSASFIIGHPTDTIATIEKTLILASVINEFGLSAVAFATPFPGTKLYLDSEQLGMNIAVKNWRKYDTMTPIFSTANFDLNDLRRAHYVYVTNCAKIRGLPLVTGDLYAEFWESLDALKVSLRSALAAAS